MPEITRKPLSWFKLRPQARKKFDEDGLRRLGESLKRRQVMPVLAQPDGTIIAGERRFRAAQLVGLESLEVTIADRQLSDSEAALWQLTENMLREDLTGYEKWVGCTDILSMNVDWQAKDLAEHLHVDPSLITRILSPSKCIFEVQEALKEGKVGLSDTYAISKQPEAKQSAMLAFKLSGASRDELESVGRRERRKENAGAKVSSIRCQLASGVRVVVSGAAICIDTLIDALAEAGREAKRARDQGQDAKTLQAILKNKSKARVAR